jgi:hypothetical protein
MTPAEAGWHQAMRLDFTSASDLRRRARRGSSRNCDALDKNALLRQSKHRSRRPLLWGERKVLGGYLDSG